MIKYVAFLRGINVGGHKTIKMEELKKAFAAFGFENVKTLLASGNVLFAAPPASESTLAKKSVQRLDALAKQMEQKRFIDLASRIFQ